MTTEHKPDKTVAPPPDKPPDPAIPPEHLATPPVGPPLEGGKQVVALMGPLRGSVLTMPEAEADQAVSDNWATPHPAPPFDQNAPLPDPLTDEERKAAYDAAVAWTDAARNPESVKPPKDKAPAPPQTRSMQPGPEPAYPTKNK